MATPEEIRKKLETQASQRVNPLLKGLSMLTGGIAGEFTGTNEQIRQQRSAKRALMEEDLAALQEERLMERVKAQQAEMLKRQLELETARTDAENRRRLLETAGTEEALTGKYITGPVEQSQELGRQIGRLQRLSVDQKEAAEKARIIGRLTAEMGPTEKAAIESGVMPDYSQFDISTLRRMEGASDVSLRKQEEARRAKQDEGKVFVSRNAAGDVSVQGPSDLVSRFQAANPDFFMKKKDSPYKVSMRQTEDGNSFNVDFGEMTVSQVEELAPQIDKMRKAYGVSLKNDLSGAGGEGTKEFPKGPAAEKEATQVKRRTGETLSGAADAVVSEMAAPPVTNMYGPLSPSEQFTKTGRQLKALEGRGGAYTYGASQTLTDPFYESVASELGTKPQRIGQESVLVKGAKSVIANEFPTEQWNSLPQEVKNRIYIEALNKSAAEMAKPQTSRGYNRSPFADISYQRD